MEFQAVAVKRLNFSAIEDNLKCKKDDVPARQYGDLWILACFLPIFYL
ncbi:MAG: hypothetical protein LBE13_21630 [Bacteroidales bacterium]|nr:hypothetical protein [Bacteroidales bacterium]